VSRAAPECGATPRLQHISCQVLGAEGAGAAPVLALGTQQAVHVCAAHVPATAAEYQACHSNWGEIDGGKGVGDRQARLETSRAVHLPTIVPKYQRQLGRAR
jgi:hypothetical protein